MINDDLLRTDGDTNDDDDDDNDDTHYHHLEIVHGTHDSVEENSILRTATGIHLPPSVDRYNPSGGGAYGYGDDADDATITDASTAATSSVDKQSRSSRSSSRILVEQSAVISLPSIVENNSNSSSNNSNRRRRERGRSESSKDTRAVVGAIPTEKLPPI